MYSRVCEMLTAPDNKRDLSRNDREALRYVLGLVNALADTVAEQTGLPIPTVVDQHGAVVRKAQQIASVPHGSR